MQYNSGMAEKKTQQQKLLDNLESINEKLEKRVSLRYTFVHGMVNGLGTFIGATIVAAIVLALLAWILDIFDITIVRDFVEDTTQN